MKWKKNRVYIEDLPKLVNQFKMSIKNGDPILERIRCVYVKEDSDLINCLTPFDFIDELNKDLKIQSFSTYQVLEI